MYKIYNIIFLCYRVLQTEQAYKFDSILNKY